MKKNTAISIILPKNWYIFRVIGRRLTFAITYGVVLNALVWYVISLWSPPVGEAFIYNVAILSGLMTAGWYGYVAILSMVGISPLVSFTATMSYQMWKNRNIPHIDDDRQNALPAGTNHDIYPDRIAVETPFGNRTEFEYLVRDRHETLPKNSWLFVFEFRRDYARVAEGSETGAFVNRLDIAPPVETDHVFASETPEQYYAWIDLSVPALKAYMEKKRIEKTDKNIVAAVYQKAVVVVFVLLFLSLSAMAQSNTDKVNQFLGQPATDVPGIDEPVLFRFEKGDIIRYGDKKTPIGRMVAQRVGADAADYGQLKSVYRSGSLVAATGKQIIPATGTTENPKELFATHMEASHNEAVQPTKTFAESMPDSTQVAAALDEAKRQLPFYKSALYKVFHPIIELMAWLFFFLCPLFGVALGFCNLVSRSAQQNGNLGPTVADQQIRFAAAAWWIAMLLVGSAYLCITASMFFWQWHPVAIGIVCLVGYIPAKWAINRLTPNGDHQQTTVVTRQRGISGGGNNQRFIG